MFSRNKLENRIRELEKRILHLENKEKAEKLLEEYKRLASESICLLGGFIYSEGCIRMPGVIRYELDTFEHEILCPLRKQKLDRLEMKAACPTETGTTTVELDPGSYDISYKIVSSTNKKKKRRTNVRKKNK